ARCRARVALRRPTRRSDDDRWRNRDPSEPRGRTSEPARPDQHLPHAVGLVDLALTAEQRAWRDEVRALADSYGAEAFEAVRAEMESLDVERHAPSFYQELCRRGWVG